MCFACYQKKLLRNCPKVCYCVECVHDDYYRCSDWGWQYPNGAFEKLDDISLAFNNMSVSGNTQHVFKTNMLPNPLSRYSNLRQATQYSNNNNDHNVHTTNNVFSHNHNHNNHSSNLMAETWEQQQINQMGSSMIQTRANMVTHTQIPMSNTVIASSRSLQPMDC